MTFSVHIIMFDCIMISNLVIPALQSVLCSIFRAALSNSAAGLREIVFNLPGASVRMVDYKHSKQFSKNIFLRKRTLALKCELNLMTIFLPTKLGSRQLKIYKNLNYI